MLSWTLHQKVTPSVQDLFPVVAVRHELYYFGGTTDGRIKGDRFGVRVFNTVSLRWRKLTPAVKSSGRGEGAQDEAPPIRGGHTAVLIGDVIYLWGGITGDSLDTYYFSNVLYAFDVDTHRWSKPRVSGTVPDGRSGHTACVLGRFMYVLSGQTEVEGPLVRWPEDMHKLDTSAMVWSSVDVRGTPPCCPSGRSATVIGTKIFVMGGSGSHWSESGVVKAFNTESNEWLTITPPPAWPRPVRRFWHSAFAYGGELYVFGGVGQRDLNDLWRFSPQSFTWRKLYPRGLKGPGQAFLMCCCTVGDRVFLFGGRDTPNNLFVLDLSPSLKTLSKLAVLRYDLNQSGLPHDVRGELVAMRRRKRNKKTN